MSKCYFKNFTTSNNEFGLDGIDGSLINNNDSCLIISQQGLQIFVANTSSTANTSNSVIAPAINGDNIRWFRSGLLSEIDDVVDLSSILDSKADASELALKADLVEGKVPSNQLPAYVDDVLEYANNAVFPVTGESGLIYIDLFSNKTYRWANTVYVEISQGVSLGETSSTAYRGDRGKIAYDHTANTSNPHGITKTQLVLGNVDNTSDLNKPVSTAQQTALNAKLANTHYGTGGSNHAVANTSSAGFMSSADKIKLDNSTATPTANTIVISSNTGKLDTWISDANTSSAGKVELATDAEAIAGANTALVVTCASLNATLNAKVGIADSELIKTALNASGYAPIYACRAWVKFNGTGTVAILGSGNVSSINDNGTGLYTINFSTAMPDSNYSVNGFATNNDDSANESFVVSRNPSMTYTSSACQITTTENTTSSTIRTDSPSISIQFFR